MNTSAELSGRVLVLGEDTRSFLSVVRSLGRFGLKVDVAWCAANSASLKSKYIRQVHRLPEYRFAERQWLDELLQLLSRERFDLVIPCHDSNILPLQVNRIEVEAAGRVYLLSDYAFEVSSSKQKTYELAASLGVPVPRQHVVHSLAEMDAAAEDFGFPLVIKPRSSAVLSDPASKQAVVKISNAAAIGATLQQFDLAAGVLVQQNFFGDGVGVEVLCDQGEVLTAFQHRRIHEPRTGGGSSYRKSVPLDPDLLDATRRLMRALAYTGVAMVEFKVNSETGKWVLIEINGRFWGSLPLSIAAGLDFPQFLYQMRCFGEKRFPQEFRNNVYARNWLSDIYWLRSEMDAAQSRGRSAMVPVAHFGFEWLKRSFLETNDTLVWDDPGPGLEEIRQLSRNWILPRIQRTQWARRNVQRDAEAAIQQARSILFLCKGNICRSPFAEHLLSAAGSHVKVASAGYYPVEGRRSPHEAVDAASRWGVDLSTHVSRVVTDPRLDAADVILIFDRQHYAALEARNPAILKKVHYLGGLDASGALEIDDPFGNGIESYLSSYERIHRLLTSPVFKAHQMRSAKGVVTVG